MTDRSVVIAGGGPTGMMLAAELTLAGTDVLVIERRQGQELDGSRAGGLHARTIEVLDQRGVAERFLDEGQRHPAVGYAYIQLDITDFPSRHPMVLALWQSDFERILATWVEELGVPIRRGATVTGLTQDDDGVDVALDDGTTLRTQYLVGCDGGRSVVRKAAGIEFPGVPASTSWMIAEADMDGTPETGLRPEGGGIGPVDPASGGGPYRMVLREEPARLDEPTLETLRETLVAMYGSDFGVQTPRWLSRFTDMARQAAAYRAGRVLLAGDAAHVHPPLGGQGLNVGVQDAVNLGWKLAQVVTETSSPELLDTYHAERHPVGARVLANTIAQTALTMGDDRHRALHSTMAELLAMEEPRRRIAGMISGLDVHYDLGGGHPLLGRRMPDLDLRTAEGTTRVATLLHDARPFVLDLSPASAIDISPWADRVDLVQAEHDGPWEMPVLGEVPAPAAVLVRPDGHVAWTGEPGDPELLSALTRWFGPPLGA